MEPNTILDPWLQLRMKEAALPILHRETVLEGKMENAEWIEMYSQIKSRLGKGCLFALIGNRGTGKTQMAVKLAIDLIMRDVSRENVVLYRKAIEIFSHIKSTYGKSSSLSEMDVIKKFRSPKLLIIDELTQKSDNAELNSMFTLLIDQRYEDRKDTILTGNSEPDKIGQFLADSVISRINEKGGLIQCNWESFRK